MLVEFTVGNYRSFKEPVTLSMVAAKIKSKDKRLDADNVFEAPDGERLLKSAALYGANASGKSNLIEALEFMRMFARRSAQVRRARLPIYVEPFRLDTRTQGDPSLFEVVFFMSGHRYRYGFEVAKDRVVSEWLFWVPKSREARLFVREGDQFKVSPAFARESRILEKHTRKDALFLSVVAQLNGRIAMEIQDWFMETQVLGDIFDLADRLRSADHLRDEPYKRAVIEFVKEFDLGIASAFVEEAPFIEESVLSRVSENTRKLMGITADGKLPTIKTVHQVRGIDGKLEGTAAFDLERHESGGTKKLFDLAGPIFAALSFGKILIADELDVRLHPLITSTIVRMFNSPETNPNNAQLIFTTHDTNLLDADLLRRDQIWFLEKDDQEASHLHSLVEYKVRNDASFEKDYIRGKYGAIPFIGGVTRIAGDSDE